MSLINPRPTPDLIVITQQLKLPVKVLIIASPAICFNRNFISKPGGILVDNNIRIFRRCKKPFLNIFKC